jgi:hypothetical protein
MYNSQNMHSQESHRWTLLALFFLLGANPSIFGNAQGINLSVPGFSEVLNLGTQKDREIQHRWWFWLIIGFIAALFIVLGFFTFRGVDHWRAHKKKAASLEQQNERIVEASKLEPLDAFRSYLTSSRNGDRALAVELAQMEEGRKIENKEEGTRVTVEVERDPSWTPKYGVNWVEVQRRTGPTPGQQQRHHHRRHKTGSNSLGGSTEVA